MTRPSARKAPRPASPEMPGEAPLILVVDDFEDNRRVYVQYLTFSGFRVAEAENGMEALERAFALRPDLVVMDLSLPVMDGWEATRRLKSDERTRGTPVVALTGHAMVGQSKEARGAGCDAYIPKPCLPEDLVATIRPLLGPTTAKGRRKKRGGGP